MPDLARRMRQKRILLFAAAFVATALAGGVRHGTGCSLFPRQARRQLVGVVDQPEQLVFWHRAVELDGVPVPLAEVVARGNCGCWPRGSTAMPGLNFRLMLAGGSAAALARNILPPQMICIRLGRKLALSWG
jgi:hypothetical protein